MTLTTEYECVGCGRKFKDGDVLLIGKDGHNLNCPDCMAPVLFKDGVVGDTGWKVSQLDSAQTAALKNEKFMTWLLDKEGW